MSIIFCLLVTFLRVTENCIWNRIFMLSQIYASTGSVLPQPMKQRSLHYQNYGKVFCADCFPLAIFLTDIFWIKGGLNILLTVPRRYFFCGSFMFLFCLVFAMSLCAFVYMCFVSSAEKRLTSWLSSVVSAVSLSLSHWYPWSGAVLDCIDSWSLHPYLLKKATVDDKKQIEKMIIQ